MLPASRAAFTKPVAMILLAAVVVVCLLLVVGGENRAGQETAVSASGKWTCSMCPQFILPEPGKCPKCFMDLIPLDEGAMGGGKLELFLTPEAATLAGIHSAVIEAVESGDADRDTLLVAVPATAVLENIGRSFVYTESEDGEYRVFRLREVLVAGRDGDMVLIESGIDEGEAVAVSGAFRIDSAMQILGKVSLVNLPDGDLADVDGLDAEPYQPAERSDADVRSRGVPVDDWFGQYELLRAALAQDNLAGTRSPSQSLQDAVSAVRGQEADPTFGPLRENLLDSVRRLAQAESLSAKRDLFEKVSADMVLLARRYGAPKGGLNLIFCPMAFGGAGAHWLQPQETVDNPYHGLEMPLCGWQVEKIAE